MNILSLFAGVGGMELGLEAAGMRTVGQVEIDDYCQRVLARHWPDTDRHDDVTTAPEWWASKERPHVDLICAGFPCQPFSLAGKQLGTNDERWMWPATERVIREVGPRFVLLENVAALVRDSGAFGAVLGGLHSLGFDAEWATLYAPEFGAPQAARGRVYVLAYAAGLDGHPRDRVGSSRAGRAPFATGGLRGLDVAARRAAADQWLATEPRVDRLADGIPAQSHRLRCAGNAVIPAAAEHIGRQIMSEFALERAA